jgi:hypothetical protein
MGWLDKQFSHQSWVKKGSVRKDAVAAKFAAADADCNSLIDFEEFCKLEANEGKSRDNLRDLFAQFDADRNGHLDEAEFRAYVEDGQPKDYASWKKMRAIRSGVKALGTAAGKQLATGTDSNSPRPAAAVKRQTSLAQHAHNRSFLGRQHCLGGGQGGSLQKSSEDHRKVISEHQMAYKKGLLAMNENLSAVLERIFQHVAASELAQEGVHSSSSKTETMDIGTHGCMLLSCMRS